MNETLSILHFNDVYDIQPEKVEPKGGAAYFKVLLEQYRRKDTLTLFSGDVFAPSLLSSAYKGRNMLKPLNSFKIDLACLGNHDLDYTYNHVVELKNSTNFPWLCSNIFDKRTNKRMIDCEQYWIFERAGIKIGVFSLAEKQWVDTLYPEYYEIIEYYPFLDFAEYMVNFLKGEKCDMIIAQTHMMKYNDIKLAKQFPQIDFILGGHDHLIVHELVNNTIMVKSGTNFKHFSFLEICKVENYEQNKKIQGKFIIKNSRYALVGQLVEVNHEERKIQPDPELHAYVQEIYEQFSHRQNKIALYVNQEIDLRFKTIRLQQSDYLEFIVSIYRHYASADCALMNSGNFRMDQILKPGPVTYGVATNIIEDTVILKKVPGEKIIKALQNCVSMYPNFSGRFSVVSGISFTWDCRRKPYERILEETVQIGGEKVDKQKIYKVAMHSFTGDGGDGYGCFKDCPEDENHLQKKNLVLMHEFLSRDENLMKGFVEKYPNRLEVIEFEGESIYSLTVPPAKNILMIGEHD